MKVVVLAGGRGTRLAEETEVKPKPMVEIGGRPILWHIMKHFSTHGLNEFYITLGYKGEVIKRYFLDYSTLRGDLTINLATGNVEAQDNISENWTVHLMETGLETHTGGRVRRLQAVLENETFIVTYGDGVSDIDVSALIDFHKSHGLCGTVTAVRPPARYGGLYFEGDRVSCFTEKPQTGEGWINGGFLVFEPRIFKYLKSDQTALEHETLTRLAADGQLAAYRHDGFWQCMDTLRDKMMLNQLWETGAASWKTW